MTEHNTSEDSPARGSRRSRRHRWARRLTWVVVTLLVILGVIWLVTPPLVKWQGQRIATEKLGRPVHIGAVAFKPWSLELTLREVSVSGAQPTDPPQFGFKRLYIRLAPESVWRLAPVLDAIQVDEPALRLRYLDNGHYDVDDVIARLNSGPKPPPDQKPTCFALYNIAVQGGRVTFIDDSVHRTHEVRDLRLALPFISNLPAQRKVDVMPQFAFTVDGSRFDLGGQTLPFDASHRTEAHLILQRFDLTPYLVYQPANLPVHVTAGALDADLRLTFEQAPKPMLKVAGTVNLSDVKVNGATGESALTFERLTVNASDVRPLERVVHLASVDLTAPRLRVARNRDGRWMFQDWQAKSKPGQETKQTARRAAPDVHPEPWAVHVEHIAVTNGGVGWLDQQPASGAVDVALSQLKLDVQDFDLNGSKPMPLQLSARLVPRHGNPGQLAWHGMVAFAPVSAQGEVDVERLPLQAFEPYMAGQLNVDILRADASFKGQVDYAQQSAGPHLRVAGDARVEDLRATSHPGSAAANDVAPGGAEAKAARSAVSAPVSRAALAPNDGAANAAVAGGIGEELLNWKQLSVAGLDVRLDPGQAPQAAVKDSRLSDFYARVIVHPNGRINLQDLVKSAAPEQGASAPVPAASMPASAASGAGASPGAPVMRFGPLHLVRGRISFTDHFIRPNYSADLTELNGSLGAFSSVTNSQAPQLAALQLTGRAEGTAQLVVNGKLNPLAKPLALDIAAKVTDLELPPLSPYSVKYSGHGIERGKLSLDVAYKIAPDGQLTASNRLVLNQLQFGDLVPGAPASLPVSLAVALLADSNGVIDLDLPISGSINDPQFSLGPIIFKAIINIIGKAITAPFSLLAHALGGGDSLSQVPFALGSVALSDAAKVQLDKIAKALVERPQIKLTVTGAARLDEEREDFKRERLKAMVAAEGRTDDGAAAATSDAATQTAAAASGATAEAVPGALPPASAASGAAAANDPDYAQRLRRLYRRADIPGKPRNLVGMSQDVPVAQMEALLLAHINVDEDDIRQLATGRAMAVKDYLLAQHLSADRIFIGAAKANSASDVASGAPLAAAEPASAAASTAAPATSHWTPHAELELSAR